MALIGISGKIGSGKDTVGKIIQYLTSREYSKMSFSSFCLLEERWYNYDDWEIKKFATKLKQIVSILTGIPVEDLEKQEIKNNWYINYQTGEVRDKNNINSAFFIETVEQLEEALQTKSLNFWVKIRVILEYEGTQIGRDKRGENSWLNALFADYKPKYIAAIDPYEDNIEVSKVKSFDIFPNWIITDLRFPNELKAIKDRQGITIRVNRSEKHKIEAVGGKINITHDHVKSYEHESETALDNAEFDYTIDNNGTIEELIEKVKEILTKTQII